MPTAQQLDERIAKWTAAVEREDAEIKRLQSEGAYRYGAKNPRGRMIKKQIREARNRRVTAQHRLNIATRLRESAAA